MVARGPNRQQKKIDFTQLQIKSGRHEKISVDEEMGELFLFFFFFSASLLFLFLLFSFSSLSLLLYLCLSCLSNEDLEIRHVNKCIS